MNITSNLKPGFYLDPEPLARLLAEPIFRAIMAERELTAKCKEVEMNGGRETGRPENRPA